MALSTATHAGLASTLSALVGAGLPAGVARRAPAGPGRGHRRAGPGGLAALPGAGGADRRRRRRRRTRSPGSCGRSRRSPSRRRRTAHGVSVPAGGSTPADNPRRAAPDVEAPGRRARRDSDGVVPVLSRVAHDRAHLARVAARPDRRPAGAGAHRRRQADGAGRRGPDGPQLVWDEQPELPARARCSWARPTACRTPPSAGERALTVNGRPVDSWAGLREVGADLADLDAGLLVQAIGILEWHERQPVQPAHRRGDDDRAAGWVQRDPTTGTEVFPRTDPAVIMLVHDGGDRVVLGPPGGLAARPVLDPGRLRRAGGVGRGRGRPRGRRGGRAAGHRHPLRGQPAVAVPAVADAGLRRPGRRRRRARARPGRDRGGPLVHPRRAARGRGPARPAAAGVDRPAHPRPLDKGRAAPTPR